MEEVKKINKAPNAKKYTNVHEMFQEILEDGTES
jgi:hypothetical protein